MSTDLDTVTALLAPLYSRYGFTTAAGERDGDVIVRAEGPDARWVLPQCAATLREAGIRVRQDDDHLTAQLWPYDAVRHDPLTVLRIPVVRDSYPSWKYEVCVVITEPGSSEDVWGPGLRPDGQETAQLVAALEWRMLYYNESWKAGMRKRPLDVDGSTNTVVLQKYAEGSWGYRRASWTMGPRMVPLRRDEPATLEQVLDRCWDYGAGEPNPKWREFKAAHPKAFEAVAAR